MSDKGKSGGDKPAGPDKSKGPDKPKGKGRAETGLKVKVKTARGRTASSVRWLQRQLNDPYVVKARKEGWRSRAAFKLIEIDEKYHLLKPGNRVVDLGAAPGGWCQVAAKKTGSTPGNPLVVGIDYLEMDGVPGVALLQKDFLDDDAPEALMAALGGHTPDVVLSDMAAPRSTTRMPRLRICAFSSISMSLKAARERQPSRRARAT